MIESIVIIAFTFAITFIMTFAITYAITDWVLGRRR